MSPETMTVLTYLSWSYCISIFLVGTRLYRVLEWFVGWVSEVYEKPLTSNELAIGLLLAPVSLPMFGIYLVISTVLNCMSKAVEKLKL